MNISRLYRFPSHTSRDSDLAQIAESFRRFGLADDSSNILAIKVAGVPEAVDKHVRENIDGDLVSFTDGTLAEMSDPSRLRKVYKIDANATGRQEAEAFLLGSMALKGS